MSTANWKPGINHQFDIEIDMNLDDNTYFENVFVPYVQYMSILYCMYSKLFYPSLLIVADFYHNMLSMLLRLDCQY